jgi:hypothetical protein
MGDHGIDPMGNPIMPSNKQLEANRANAKNSTGPRSRAGKARSRLNSRKHGLTAKTLITVGECADDFDQLRAELIDEHEPQSSLECELVERLAGILWRLRRVPFFEAAILDARHSQVWNGLCEAERHDGEEQKDEEKLTGKSRFISAKPLLMMRDIVMRLGSWRATRQP